MSGAEGAIIAAAIAAASSIAGGVMANQQSASNATAGNAAAFQIADANRKDAQFQYQTNLNQSRDFFDRGQGFAKEMWDKASKQAEYMSSTAYQRAFLDMELAGLNPILAYQQGGAAAQSPGPASGPSGSAPGSTSSPSSYQHQMPRVENVLGGAASSAVQAAQVVQNIRQSTATIENTNALTGQAHAQTTNLGSQARLNDAQTAYVAAQEMTERERQRFVAEQARLERLRGDTEAERPQQVRDETYRTHQQGNEARERAAQAANETQRQRDWGVAPNSAAAAAAAAEAAIQRGARNLDRVLRPIAP